MGRPQLKTVLIALLLFLCSLSGGYAAELSARITKVLVLHSYHQGLLWTDSITSGIEAGLSDLSRNLEFHYEYLDTKRHSGPEYRDQLFAFSQFKAG